MIKDRFNQVFMTFSAKQEKNCRNNDRLYQKTYK